MVMDRNVTLRVSSGKRSVKVLCPGGQYTVEVVFPGPRLALVTTSLGTLKDATNKSCANQMVTPRRHRVRNVTTVLTVACAASGRELDFKVTSASKKTASLGFMRAMLPVDSAAAPRCAAVSAACAPARPAQIKSSMTAEPAASSSTFVPLTPNKVDSSKTDAKEVRPKAKPEPVYTFMPVLTGHQGLWQFLHSLLMLLSFCFLLPVGALLSRHKWIFGRDDLSGRVLKSWAPVHVIAQLLGVFAAAAGVTIAILAFGWKSVPGQPLYVPHKWAGIGVMGMALVQALLGMLRPSKDKPGRGMWNAFHHNWGRLTIIGGMGNAILGALLIHDYKDVSMLHWLLPASLLVGVMGILALTLEAFKLQMQRTYRYNARSGNMLPVLEGYKHSKKRPHGGAAKFAAGVPADHQSDSDESHVRDTDSVDQATHYPAVTHRAGPVKTSIKPPQFGPH